MEFEYFYVTAVNASINIDDIGNCAIAAYSDLGAAYYLVIKTILGSTMVFEYGPIIQGSNVLPKSVNCSFKRIEYRDTSIQKIIRTFLNNPAAKITQALEVPMEEVFENCIDIIEYMKTQEF